MLDTIVCSEPLVWPFFPAWDAGAVILSLDVGFICPFVVIDPTDQGATKVVAPAGRMIDNFLLVAIPDAESLPLYHMVLVKLACVCGLLRTAVQCWW
jgi:fumarate reductase subunit D